jgi:hypothetical protein
VRETWKLYIIEIAVPFGRGDKEDMHRNILKNIMDFKTNKYTRFVRSVNKQFKVRISERKNCGEIFSIYYIVVRITTKQIN